MSDHEAYQRERQRDLEDTAFEQTAAANRIAEALDGGLYPAISRIADALEELAAPHRMSGVTLRKGQDGYPKWFVSFGAFGARGETPAEACAAFDKLWRGDSR